MSSFRVALGLKALALPLERVKEIHTEPCEHCPSVHSPHDPESADIKASWGRAEQLESVFPCAWRPDKACKGYCDYLEVTEKEIGR